MAGLGDLAGRVAGKVANSSTAGRVRDFARSQVERARQVAGLVSAVWNGLVSFVVAVFTPPGVFVLVGVFACLVFLSAGQVFGPQSFEDRVVKNGAPVLEAAGVKDRGELAALFFASKGLSKEASAYLGVLVKRAPDGFGVSVPDLSGCDSRCLLSRLDAGSLRGEDLRLGVFKLSGRLAYELVRRSVEEDAEWASSRMQLAVVADFLSASDSPGLRSEDAGEAVRAVNQVLGLSLSGQEVSASVGEAESLAKLVGKKFAGSLAAGTGEGRSRVDGGGAWDRGKPDGGSGGGEVNTGLAGGKVFKNPIEGPLKVTSPFGYRVHPVFGKADGHTGTDINAPCGMPQYAIRDGVVVESRYGTGYGNFIKIDHGVIDGVHYHSLHAHFVDGGLLVRKGQKVRQGEKIGLTGSTGFSTGCHVHLELHKNGVPVNVMPYLKAG